MGSEDLHEWVLTSSENPVRLKVAGGGELFLTVAQRFRTVPDERASGEWRVNTLLYAYHVFAGADRSEEILLWHWQPDIDAWPSPHLHFGPGLLAATSRDRWTDLVGRNPQEFHIPTGRVSFEAVVRFLIEELGVQPNRDDWDDMLTDAQRRFDRARRW